MASSYILPLPNMTYEVARISKRQLDEISVRYLSPTVLSRLRELFAPPCLV